MGTPPDFPGSTEMHEMANSHDWARTRLGAVSTWPMSLRVLVKNILSARYPMIVMWGPEFISIYNDGYRDLAGAHHPQLFGGSASEVFGESWAAIVPPIQGAMDTGETTWFPALQLPMIRHGYREETYFTASHAAATDDDGVVAGMYGVCNDVTDQVIGSRRLALLTELSAASELMRGTDEMSTDLCAVLQKYPLDVPFVSFFLEKTEVLKHVAGNNDEALIEAIRQANTQAIASKVPVLVPVTQLGIAAEPWGDSVSDMIVAPVISPTTNTPMGTLAFGVSPYRLFDEEYRAFVDTLVRHVSVALGNAEAFQHERRRAETLEELDRVKTAFFSNMSHEIRTPINAVVGGASLLLDSRLDGEQKELVEMIGQSSQHLIGIVNDVLDYAKLDAGKFEFAIEPFSVADCISSAVGLVRTRAAEKGIAICVGTAKDMPKSVMGDGPRLRQVLINLLSNAVKFTEAGSISVDAAYSSGRLRIDVSDTGVGIPADRLDSVFDAFSQIESKISTGTGLGLSISSSLATGMGGTIDVVSKVGEGSTFSIDIPAPQTNQAPSVAPQHVIDKELAQRLPLRILIAEDHETNQQVLAALLKRLGYKPDLVDTGAAAVDAVVNGSYDLVLMDIQMPIMDGLEASMKIARLVPAGRRPQIVALTANARYESKRQALDAGMDGYMTKPFRLEELVTVLSSASEGRAVMAPSRQTEVFDRQQLAPLMEIEPGAVIDLIDTFMSSAETLINTVRSAVEGGRSHDSALKAALHELKGASATVGAVALSECCTYSIDGVESLPDQLHIELERLREVVHLRD